MRAGSLKTLSNLFLCVAYVPDYSLRCQLISGYYLKVRDAGSISWCALILTLILSWCIIPVSLWRFEAPNDLHSCMNLVRIFWLTALFRWKMWRCLQHLLPNSSLQTSNFKLCCWCYIAFALKKSLSFLACSHHLWHNSWAPENNWILE